MGMVRMTMVLTSKKAWIVTAMHVACRAFAPNPILTYSCAGIPRLFGIEVMSELRHRTLKKNLHGAPTLLGRPEGDLPSYSFLQPPEKHDEIGRLAGYRVLRLLGRGGMGYVFHAEDATLRRPVALKVMKIDDTDPTSLQRFLREARAMAAIKHDSLVTVYQAGQEKDALYLAMELLSGVSLHEWIDRNPKADPAYIIYFAIGIARGLSAIHQNGLVHRDIKPGN